MIWEKYDNEVDPVIWHEFFYSHRPLRASTTNAKSDGLEGVQSYRVRRPGDGSATDVRHKKKNQSTALSPLAGVYLPLHRRVRVDGRGDGRPPGPAHFRARLDLDVFYFTTSGPCENFLGFLSPCAAGESPKPLEDDHWFFKTRKLAFQDCDGSMLGMSEELDIELGEFDIDALRRHRMLEVIYLIKRRSLPSETPWGWDGFSVSKDSRFRPGDLCWAFLSLFIAPTKRPRIFYVTDP
ncbi:hypothetical protein PG987_005354 [Apiospora arundinis]